MKYIITILALFFNSFAFSQVKTKTHRIDQFLNKFITQEIDLENKLENTNSMFLVSEELGKNLICWIDYSSGKSRIKNLDTNKLNQGNNNSSVIVCSDKEVKKIINLNLKDIEDIIKYGRPFYFKSFETNNIDTLEQLIEYVRSNDSIVAFKSNRYFKKKIELNYNDVDNVIERILESESWTEIAMNKIKESNFEQYEELVKNKSQNWLVLKLQLENKYRNVRFDQFTFLKTMSETINYKVNIEVTDPNLFELFKPDIISEKDLTKFELSYLEIN